MHSVRALLALATTSLAATSLAAQQRYIAPLGAEFYEGNSASDIMLGNWNPNTRTQQIDNNLVGVGPTLIMSLGFRRNGAGNVGAAKTTDLTITMSHADYALVTNTFASNYKDPPQVVFTRKPVSLPDWNTPVTIVPAPMDVVLPLDFSFVYNRADALLFDVQNENNPLGIYTQDWISGTPAYVFGAFPENLGVGCATANGTMLHRTAMRANSTTLDLGFLVQGGPSNAPVVVLLGMSDPNVPLPGLCAAVRTLPVVNLAMAATDASGRLPLTYPVSVPWLPSYSGLTFFTQALAPDASQAGLPIAASNGVRAAGPATAGPGNIKIKRIYHTSSATALTGTGPSVSAVPTLYIGF